MALQAPQRSGTLDNVPGMSDDMKRMYAMLKRMESVQSSPALSDLEFSDEEELDSDDEQTNHEDLSKRLEGVNLDNADDVWSKLTENERQEFEQIVKSDNVGCILPEFHGWWEHRLQRVLIREVGSAADTAVEHQYANLQYPKIYEAIPEFDLISKIPPAPCVPFNLVNVLASYAMTVRFFLGQHLTNSYEAVNYLMTVCTNFDKNANFDDDALAIESVRHAANTQGFNVDDNDLQQMKQDVDFIKEGPDPTSANPIFVLAALSDLRQLIVTAKATKRKPSKMGTSQSCVKINGKTQELSDFARRFADHEVLQFFRLDKTKLLPVIKKVEYYLAYVKKFR